jgi:DNA-binding XRE family transcriptional regulator
MVISGMQKKLVKETDLGKLAKRSREQAGLTKAELARQLHVTRGTIQQAEEYPEISLTKVRTRIIEKCASLKISGPFYLVENRAHKRS